MFEKIVHYFVCNFTFLFYYLLGYWWAFVSSLGLLQICLIWTLLCMSFDGNACIYVSSGRTLKNRIAALFCHLYTFPLFSRYFFSYLLCIFFIFSGLRCGYSLLTAFQFPNPVFYWILNIRHCIFQVCNFYLIF